MELATFFTEVRRHYVAQFVAFTTECRADFPRGASEVALQMRPESALYGKLYCADFLGDAGQGPDVQELVPDDVLAFDRVTVPLGLVYVSIESMGWDDCVIEHDVIAVPEAELAAWFAKWFAAERDPSAALSQGIHSLIVGEGTLSLDLGTAPAEALTEILDLIVRAGAQTIRISGSREAGPA